MALLEWQDDYLVGVPDVDNDHKTMIQLINALYAQLESGQYNVTVIDFLGELYASVTEHFAREEQVMREHHYSDYEDHKADHDRLLDDICSMMYDYQDGVLEDHQLMSGRLQDWFMSHFRGQDARLHELLDAQRNIAAAG